MTGAMVNSVRPLKRQRLFVFCGALLCLVFISVQVWAASEFNGPWRSNKSSIILDAYEYTPIDWGQITKNRRLVGFINKASDGLAPKYGCKKNALCRAKWYRYSATKELYHTRRHLAKTLGLKWGAYHLARPGNPIKQAQHFLRFTKPDKDDLLALDIEHNDPKKWMSLSDAEKFAQHIKDSIGRYPVLYTNHNTAKFVAKHSKKYPILSRLNLWYARYRPSVPGVFPMGNWKSYTLWQFSSYHNCNKRKCLRRIKGASEWIDVNVVNMRPSKLRKKWPFAALTSKSPVPEKNGFMALALNGTTTKNVVTEKDLPASQTSKSVVMADVGEAIIPNWRPGTKIPVRTVRAKATVAKTKTYALAYASGLSISSKTLKLASQAAELLANGKLFVSSVKDSAVKTATRKALDKTNTGSIGSSILPNWRPSTKVVKSAVELASNIPARAIAKAAGKLSGTTKQRGVQNSKSTRRTIQLEKFVVKEQQETPFLSSDLNAEKEIKKVVAKKPTVFGPQPIWSRRVRFEAAALAIRAKRIQENPIPLPIAMVVKDTVAVPNWREGTVFKVAVAQTSLPVERPAVAAVAIVNKSFKSSDRVVEVARSTFVPRSSASVLKRFIATENRSVADAASQPSTTMADVAPTMAVLGRVATPEWKPGARVIRSNGKCKILVEAEKILAAPSKREKAKKLITKSDVPPKMAIVGKIVRPSWRPGTKIKGLVRFISSNQAVAEFRKAFPYQPVRLIKGDCPSINLSA